MLFIPLWFSVLLETLRMPVNAPPLFSPANRLTEYDNA